MMWSSPTVTSALFSGDRMTVPLTANGVFGAAGEPPTLEYMSSNVLPASVIVYL